VVGPDKVGAELVGADHQDVGLRFRLHRTGAMPLTAAPDDSAACFRKALLFGFLKTSP
jgi:hypothetical protein